MSSQPPIVLIRLLYTSAPDAVPPDDADGAVGTVLAEIGALEAVTDGAIVAAGTALSGPRTAEKGQSEVVLAD